MVGDRLVRHLGVGRLVPVDQRGRGHPGCERESTKRDDENQLEPEPEYPWQRCAYPRPARARYVAGLSGVASLIAVLRGFDIAGCVCASFHFPQQAMNLARDDRHSRDTRGHAIGFMLRACFTLGNSTCPLRRRCTMYRKATTRPRRDPCEAGPTQFSELKLNQARLWRPARPNRAPSAPSWRSNRAR